MKPIKFTIITPKPDFAGTNIEEELKKFNIETISPEERSIFLENIDKKIDKTDFIIFATTHRGKKEKMLSVHAPGNWISADLGGLPGKVCPTSSHVLKTFFQELVKNTPKGWEATMEVTHHGPYIETPCLFIEIGSNEENWREKEAGIAIAKTIKDSIERVNNEKHNWKTAILIGGPHYVSSGNKIQLNNNEIALGHIISEHALPLTEERLKEAIEKTKEKVDLILLDWKGLGKADSKQETMKILEKSGIKVMRTSEIEK